MEALSKEESNYNIAGEIRDPDPGPDNINVTEPAPKRKRGRPAKNASAVPPAENLSPDEKPARIRRARKGDNAKLAQQLMGLHKMVAMLPGMEVFEIQPEEATILADGMQAVADEYDVVMSGKTGAAIQLFAAAAMVYTPRVIVLTKIKKQNRAQLQQQEKGAPENYADTGGGLPDVAN